MADHLARAHYYLQQAEKMVGLAGSELDEPMRNELLELAIEYKRVAAKLLESGGETPRSKQ